MPPSRGYSQSLPLLSFAYRKIFGGKMPQADIGGNMYSYIKAETIGYAVEEAIKALNARGTEQSRENQDRADITKEIQLCLDVEHPDAEPAISRCIVTDLKGLAKYDREFLDGTGDDEGWKYTYHSLYARYYDSLIAELKRNINTRRACIAMGQGDINFTDDPPCMQLIMFNYADGKLEMTVVFRSNDGVKAFPMNIHAVEMLHEKVCEEMGLPVGPLHYIANNFHAYSKDFKILESYCRVFDTAPEKRRFASLKELKELL